jgi:DNA-binding response OmpR family regulator
MHVVACGRNTPEVRARRRNVTVVLIADDEPRLRLLVCATIESDEYDVVQAEDGDDAWRLLQQHHPAVALLDVEMPGRSGLELARAIREDPSFAGTYVILLTARSRGDEVQAGLNAGADKYLTKPFSPLELLTAVQQAAKRP